MGGPFHLVQFSSVFFVRFCSIPFVLVPFRFVSFRFGLLDIPAFHASLSMPMSPYLLFGLRYNDPFPAAYAGPSCGGKVIKSHIPQANFKATVSGSGIESW